MPYATSLDLTADMIHVSDIIARITELETERDSYETDDNGDETGAHFADAYPDEAQELRGLLALMRDLLDCGGGDEKWEGQWYPGYLVADHYFTDYARDMLHDNRPPVASSSPLGATNTASLPYNPTLRRFPPC